MVVRSDAHFQRRTLLLVIGDVLSLAGAIVAAASWRFGSLAEGLDYLDDRSPIFVAVGLFLPVAGFLCGLYDEGWLGNVAGALMPGVATTAATVAAAVACCYATFTPLPGRGVMLAFALGLGSALVAVRVAYALLWRGAVLDRRCVILGDAEQARAVTELLRRHPHAELKVIGAITGEEAVQALVADRRVDAVLLGPGLQREAGLLKRLRPLRYRGVAIVDFVSLHEQLTGEVPLHLVDDSWLIGAAIHTSRVHLRRLKRLVDVAVSVALLLPAALLLIPAAIAIKLTSRGPVLYRQERSGLGGEPFQLLKLRTMRVDAERLTGPVWATDNDPRITPVGRWLRKFRIDELPQILCVLRGDMSIVGPRPERDVFVKQLSEIQPLYAERLLVRPGVTGWAQVKAPYAATVEDSFRKLQFDLYYAKHLSLGLDVQILLRTARTVLFGREREQGGIVAGQHLQS